MLSKYSDMLICLFKLTRPQLKKKLFVLKVLGIVLWRYRI